MERLVDSKASSSECVSGDLLNCVDSFIYFSWFGLVEQQAPMPTALLTAINHITWKRWASVTVLDSTVDPTPGPFGDPSSEWERV